MLMLLCGAVVLGRFTAKDRFAALPDGARSTLYGALGAAMGFVSWVAAFVAAGQLTDIELWYVQTFDSASYRWIAIVSLPVLSVVGSFVGFRLARIDNRKFNTAKAPQVAKHPLD